jgi:hypothetical protein
MDESTQGSRIFAKRDCSIEIGLEFTAALAASVADKQLRRKQALAALYALRRAYGFDRIQTLLAHRKARDIYERDTTEPAIGGEEDRENAADYSHHWRDEGQTLLGALHSSLSV